MNLSVRREKLRHLAEAINLEHFKLKMGRSLNLESKEAQPAKKKERKNQRPKNSLCLNQSVFLALLLNRSQICGI
jgi:hypothetical protein